jgi:hypothetical protein
VLEVAQLRWRCRAAGAKPAAVIVQAGPEICIHKGKGPGSDDDAVVVVYRLSQGEGPLGVEVCRGGSEIWPVFRF